jgi:hypothetical protein
MVVDELNLFFFISSRKISGMMLYSPQTLLNTSSLIVISFLPMMIPDFGWCSSWLNQGCEQMSWML